MSGETDQDDYSIECKPLQDELYKRTKSLMSEGEKTVCLALEVSRQTDELAQLRQEAASFRAALLEGIRGVTDHKNYEHVSLEDLLRIRLQENTTTASAAVESLSKPFKDELSVGAIQKLEHKLAQEKLQNEVLEAKLISLKDELAVAIAKNEIADNLNVKVSQMNERLRVEREHKTKLSKELADETKKVEALSDHIEKLMIHLKHEAIAKARSLSDQSRLQRVLDSMKIQIEHLGKKNSRKDKAIADLRDAGKLLEDQLRMMDERYMQIRSKLDWTRSQTMKTCDRKEQELQALCEKISLLTDNKQNDSASDSFKRPHVMSTRAYRPKSIFFTDDKAGDNIDSKG